MKKLLLTLAAIPLATHAIEASAQTGYYSNVNAGGVVGVDNRIANLEARFEAGLRAGVFNSTEQASIRTRLNALRSLRATYASNGFTAAERRNLQTRIRALRDELRVAGGTRWANAYGWGDTDLDAYAYGTGVRYDAYGRPIPSTTVTYDRNGRPITTPVVTYDRYGRAVATTGATYDAYGRPIPNNGIVYDAYGRPVATGVYLGQGGPYQPVPQTGVGNVLGGVLGSVVGGGGGVGGLLGTILSSGGLRTGDVITNSIAGVLGSAMGFGSQFRDTSNVYYRSDGVRVYEIDARTNQVLHIYPVR